MVFSGCEEIIPIEDFDFDYTPQIKIEADFFPQNLGKSVMRIDRTFAISDTIDIERAHIRDAEAVLLLGSDTLSTLVWADSAASYVFLNLEEFDPEIIFNPDSLASYQDTASYGGYKLTNVDFSLAPENLYTLVVTIDGVAYTTEFQPYPAVEILNLEADSVEVCECGVGSGVGTYDVLYKTMTTDTARVIWPEDPAATFYTIYSRKLDATPPLLPQVFSYPGPVLSLQGIEPGEYELVIGAMNDTWYRHYLLRDFPPNHEARNFFDNGALGYAGTLNERYLNITLVPPGQ
jgi:hypothetical protein